MTIGQALGGFAVVAAFLTILPGIDSALILRSAVTQSRRHAYVTGFGIASATFIWGAAAAVGAAALLAASEIAFVVLKIVGAAYLIYLGVSMIVASFRHQVPVLGVTPKPKGTLRAAFVRGLLADLLNPKVGVFYIALIPQFLPAGIMPLTMGLLLALVHVAESLVWFSIIIFAASAFRRFFASPRVVAWIDRITGGVLIGFGVVLVVDSTP